jgi:hypothetical protein
VRTTYSLIVATVAITSLSSICVADVAPKKQYQAESTLAQCDPNSFCEVTFPVLAAPALLKHISCSFAGSTIVNVALAARSSTDGSASGVEYLQPFLYGGLSFSGNPQYGVNAATYLFGDKGGFFSVSVSGSPSDGMVCWATGDYI